MPIPSGSRAARQRSIFFTGRQHVPEPLKIRQIPLALAALAFAAGILLARFVWQPTVVLCVALAWLGLLAVLALARAPRTGWLVLLAIWYTLGLAAAEWHPSAPQPLALLHFSDNLSRMVEATVVQVHTLPPRSQQASDADPVAPWEQTETAESGVPALSIDLALDRAEEVTPDVSRMIPVTGGVRVTVYTQDHAGGSVTQRTESMRLPELHCGDRLEMPLRMKQPERYRNPGQFQYGDLLLEQGIAARSSVAAGQMRKIGAQPGSFACRLAAAQAWASGRLLLFAASPANRGLAPALRLSAADARMLAAMLFGDRTGLTHQLRTAFERTGSFHLLVVSGLHIALVAAAVFWVARKLRLPPWLASLVTLPLAAGYALLTGLGAPAQRALAMTAVFLMARLLWRRGNSLNALGAAVLVMLVWSPPSLFEAGFQMTMLALIAIGGLAVPLGEHLFLNAADGAEQVFVSPRRARSIADAALRLRLELFGEALEAVTGRWPLRLPARGQGKRRPPFAVLTPRKLPAYLVRLVCRLAEMALVGLVTELVMVLPMAVWFNRAAVFAVPANVVVIPLLALLIPAAVATFAASLVSPALAVAPGAITAALLHLVSAVVGHLSHLAAADVRVPGPVWWVGCAAVLGWLACCWLVRRGRWGALATACALPAIAAAVLWPEPAVTAWRPRDPPATRPLELTAIDIGQGDSLLAVAPDGATMLIDAGGPIGRNGQAEVTANFDTGEQVVAPYLWSRRIRRLDVVVLTHAHTDHMGGMPAILEDLRPRELWVGIDPDSTLYRRLLQQAARLGVHVRHVHAGDQMRWGPVGVSVLAPAAGYQNHGPPKNDDSVVLALRYGAASVLLEGDAERPSEDAMLAGGSLGPVTLLKVGHHGSRTSSNPEFLTVVQPRVAVLSAGMQNPFGHPKPEVVGRFAEAHTRLYRTDLNGLTSFFLTRDGQIREQVGDGAGMPAPLLHSGAP